MLQAYKAIIRGDRIEWQGDAPAGLTSNEAMPVIITLLKEPSPAPPPNEVGAKMAAILEQLAQLGGIASIPDPVAWQREIRKDRPLPGREDE